MVNPFSLFGTRWQCYRWKTKLIWLLNPPKDRTNLIGEYARARLLGPYFNTSNVVHILRLFSCRPRDGNQTWSHLIPPSSGWSEPNQTGCGTGSILINGSRTGFRAGNGPVVWNRARDGRAINKLTSAWLFSFKILHDIIYSILLRCTINVRRLNLSIWPELIWFRNVVMWWYNLSL